MKKRKSYTAEFKAKVTRDALREEQSLSEIASEYGVHPNMVRKWREQALAGLPGLFSRKQETDIRALQAEHEAEKHELYAEIGKLSTQLAWLKKKAGRFVDTCGAQSNGRKGG